MKYVSTRDSGVSVSASRAIVNGISPDGGLYVPASFPKLNENDFKMLLDMEYYERAAFVMHKYLDDFSIEELEEYCKKAYSKFEENDPCPVVSIDGDMYIMELWHGPTHAFKDMALSILPYLMTSAREKCKVKNKTLILVATSGDTGKAALEGFKDVDNTKVMVFYPNEGVSLMQKKQMATQEGDNVYVSAIKGNFDDAQNAVKAIFKDEKIRELLDKKGYSLSSANSINWGRLVPQIAYYVSCYCDLLDSNEITMGDKINFAVPTGNFGNILAGYYAMQMGVPINKLLCASNCNNILTDFFVTGKYDINREFFKTMSPSMDILISSNLERLLYEINGRDSKVVVELMKSLADKGEYTIENIGYKTNDFACGYTSEEETNNVIDNFFEIHDYLLDPHTAVAVNVYDNYEVDIDDKVPTVIVSTASPYKFPVDIYKAIMGTVIEDPFKACRKIHSISAMEIPEDLIALEKTAIRFQDVCTKEEIKDVVVRYVS